MGRSLPDQTLGLEGTMRLTVIGVLLAFLAVVSTPTSACAEEDRAKFCDEILRFGFEHGDDFPSESATHVPAIGEIRPPDHLARSAHARHVLLSSGEHGIREARRHDRRTCT